MKAARPVPRGPRLGNEPGLPDGARDGDGGQTQLVALFDHAHGLVLSQAAVAEGNELAAFATVLDTLPDLRQVLITADALHCQRAHAAYLHRRGGHYLFTVRATSRRCAAP